MQLNNPVNNNLLNWINNCNDGLVPEKKLIRVLFPNNKSVRKLIDKVSKLVADVSYYAVI